MKDKTATIPYIPSCTSCFFSFIMCFVVGFQFNTATAQDVPDTVAAGMQNDSLIVLRADQVRDRYDQYSAGFLQNINIGTLSRELDLLEAQNNRAKVLVDSLEQEALVDTVERLKQLGKERLGRLNSFRNTVTEYRTSLAAVVDSLHQLGRDTVFAMLPAGLSSTRLGNELNSLNLRIRQTEFQTRQKLDSMNTLIRESDRLLVETEQLQSSLASGFQQADRTNRRRGAQFIWSSPNRLNRQNLVGSLRTTYQETANIKKYVADTEWTGRIFLFILSVGFFYWIYSNGKKMRQLEAETITGTESGQAKLKYPVWNDLLQSLLFFLTLLPLFSFYTPSLLVQLTQFIIIILIAIVHRRLLSRKQWYLWVTMVVFYLLVIMANSLVHDGLIMRLITIFLNLLNLAFSYRLRLGMKSENINFQISKYVHWAFIIINVLAITLNVVGYIEYGRYWSIAGAVGLVQAISLINFSRMIQDAFELQFSKSNRSHDIFSKFDKEKTLYLVKRFLFLVCLFLSIIVLVINLRQVEFFFDTMSKILGTSRNIGNIAFTFGDLLVCIIIIYLANWLQKNIGILFTDKGEDEYGQTTSSKSLMPLFRLIVILIGFFIGLSALGIGLDRLTVMISALTVGIGFGLQNIFNNFVSGIILIFEKPFRNGDFIELGDKKGRVQEIGIRSSTLLTPEGAEVIIPNGDLLSGRLVNWTLSRSTSKIGININVPREVDMRFLRKVIKEETGKLDYIMDGIEVEILHVGISADMLQLRINSWIMNVQNEDTFKSQLLEQLSLRLKVEGIQMVSA